MTADNSIAFVIILDPVQAHSVDLADLEDGDLDNEGEGPICHPMAVKDLQNILCDSVFLSSTRKPIRMMMMGWFGYR